MTILLGFHVKSHKIIGVEKLKPIICRDDGEAYLARVAVALSGIVFRNGRSAAPRLTPR